MKKRVLSLIIAILLCIQMIPAMVMAAPVNTNVETSSETLPFTDVKPGDWFYDSVDYVYNNRIMTGMTESYFGAVQNLARAQFAAILYRMAGKPAVEEKQIFPDVPVTTETEWYANAVTWAYENKIIQGYKNGNFGPADSITREQMVVMTYRYAQFCGYDTGKKADLSNYPDASKVSSWAKDAMEWAIGSGIITGDQGKINPQGDVSRAVCATIIQRYDKEYKEAPAQEETTGKLTVYTNLDEISSHGNVRLVTTSGQRILQKDLEAVGITCGDRVKVTFLDQTLEMSVDLNFSGVATGDPLLRIKDDAVELAINMGNFATKYIADATQSEDGKTKWTYKEGITGPVEFKIELIEKGAPGSDTGVQLTYTDNRSDYPNLSDEEFANFRMVSTTGMGNGTLYRTSSPVDPKHNRSGYADAALKNAGVATIVNLTDSKQEVINFPNFAESYYSTAQWIALKMEMNFDTDESRSRLAEGLRFIASHEGPYAVHCQEGKDRTGMVAALLECFMGAEYDEVINDYMLTFYNYYGIKQGDPDYTEIANNNIVATLRKLFEVDSIEGIDLAGSAERYFRRIGLDEMEIENLRFNLEKSYIEEPEN